MISHHISALPNPAPLTYTATASTMILWGLHASDIAMMISAFASVLGVTLQFYLVIHRVRRLEYRSDTHTKVIAAEAKAIRALDQKVDKNEEKHGS